MSSDNNDSISTITDYDNFNKQLEAKNWENSQYIKEMKISYTVTYCVIIILCVMFNFTVIVLCCRKFQEAAVWIMALAVTHLVSCVSVVFQFLYAYNDFQWLYKTASCKVSSYITYCSMFFTAAMLSLWTIHSAVTNKRQCKNCSIILISLSGTIATVLACPSLFSREIQHFQCIDDFDFDDSATTIDGIKRLKAAVITRFLFGLVAPALSLCINCCVVSVRKRRVKTMKIIFALKIAYLVCWGPQIFLSMIQINSHDGLSENMKKYGLPAFTMLAMSHCCISPLIFLLLGCWNKMDFMGHD